MHPGVAHSFELIRDSPQGIAQGLALCLQIPERVENRLRSAVVGIEVECFVDGAQIHARGTEHSFQGIALCQQGEDKRWVGSLVPSIIRLPVVVIPRVREDVVRAGIGFLRRFAQCLVFVGHVS
ncbi:hypothetical protein CCO03_08465 [Comamonas serinivorans]|uniref:Uncharacterized protein n=1 Tax=Comamonas serinivorans TaxID=1082851 RepID=A0A1Y0EN22_9BURK|nr:hypothetical protein CCO03_08465 [Comamonas serinivorans]